MGNSAISGAYHFDACVKKFYLLCAGLSKILMIGPVGLCIKVELVSKGITAGSLGGMKSRFVLRIICWILTIYIINLLAVEVGYSLYRATSNHKPLSRSIFFSFFYFFFLKDQFLAIFLKAVFTLCGIYKVMHGGGFLLPVRIVSFVLVVSLIALPSHEIICFMQMHIQTLRGRILETILSLRFIMFQYGIVYKLHLTGKNTSIAVYFSPRALL